MFLFRRANRNGLIVRQPIRLRDFSFSRKFANSSTESKKTPLFEFHQNLGAKLVPFAGWSMPVQYTKGITVEHLHTRSQVSLFDVSHMLQLKIHGKDRVRFIERLVVGDIAELGPGRGTLTLLTNENGGIIDDVIITNTLEGYLYVVCNAGCADKDLAHLKHHVQRFQDEFSECDVSIEELHENGLLAVQGPRMAESLGGSVDGDLSTLKFMCSSVMTVHGVPDCRVTRCGYTGEDGIEISMPSCRAVELAEKLLASTKPHLDVVQPAGLGARDSLRLEAGLCLYGNDISETVTPVESSLSWCIGKRRRVEGGFLGSERILKQLTAGSRPDKRRVGIVATSGAPARGGATVLDKTGEPIGTVTSGCPSPTLKQNIAMAYISTPFIKPNTEVQLRVRNKAIPATTAKMPFVPTKYFT